MADKTTIVYTTVDTNGVEKQQSIANAKAGITRKEAENFAKALVGLTTDTFISSAVVRRTETAAPAYDKLPPQAFEFGDDYISDGSFDAVNELNLTWNATKLWYELQVETSSLDARTCKYVSGYAPVPINGNALRFLITESALPTTYEAFANPTGLHSVSVALTGGIEATGGSAHLLFPADQDHAPVMIEVAKVS